VDAASFDTPEAEIAALRVLLAERDAALAERDARLLNATLEIEKLRIQLAALRRERYGRSSEKLDAEIGQLEMLIGDLEEDQAQGEAAAEQARWAKGKPEKPRRPALRRPLPEHLPRETLVHEPAPACRCGCTDIARLTRIGEDVTEVLDSAYCCPPQSRGRSVKSICLTSPATSFRNASMVAGSSGNR
jgi:transposase